MLYTLQDDNTSFPCDMELLSTLIYEYELSMDNKFILGLCIIGFGLLLLMSPEKHSWIFSALAVGIGSGLILKRSEKNDKDDK